MKRVYFLLCHPRNLRGISKGGLKINIQYIDWTLQKRWAVPHSAICRISYMLGLPGILLMSLLVPFLIIPRAPTITNTVTILRCHVFLYFYFQYFVFPYWFILFDGYVMISLQFFILLSVWIAKSQKIVTLSASVIGSDSVCKLFFTFQYSIIFAYFPIN